MHPVSFVFPRIGDTLPETISATRSQTLNRAGTMYIYPMSRALFASCETGVEVFFEKKSLGEPYNQETRRLGAFVNLTDWQPLAVDYGVFRREVEGVIAEKIGQRERSGSIALPSLENSDMQDLRTITHAVASSMFAHYSAIQPPFEHRYVADRQLEVILRSVKDACWNQHYVKADLQIRGNSLEFSFYYTASEKKGIIGDTIRVAEVCPEFYQACKSKALELLTGSPGGVPLSSGAIVLLDQSSLPELPRIDYFQNPRFDLYRQVSEELKEYGGTLVCLSDPDPFHVSEGLNIWVKKL